MKIQDIEISALKLLQNNTQQGEKDGKTYTFSVPSTTVYPFQWTGWDSQFHAIVWVKLGEIERAKKELRAIFAWQNKDKSSEDYGHIAHVVFYNQDKVLRSLFKWHWLESKNRSSVFPGAPKPKSTYHIQPPLLAQSVQYVWQASQDRDFLNEALDVLEAYYKWFKKRRDFDNDDLVSIIAQFESGIDYGSAYDKLNHYSNRLPFFVLSFLARFPSFYHKLFFNLDLKKIYKFSNFHQEDVLVNSIYAKNLYVLSELAQEAKRYELAAWAKQQADKTKKALIDKCYDPKIGLFWNLLGKKEKKSKVKTILSLMPLILPDLPQNIVESLVGHIQNPKEFGTPYRIPSVARDENSFLADPRMPARNYIWRGPLSLNTNWYLIHGLRQYGYNEIADDIAKKSRELVQEHGFNEFFNPLTGEPVGADKFGWATLVVDM